MPHNELRGPLNHLPKLLENAPKQSFDQSHHDHVMGVILVLIVVVSVIADANRE